MTTHYAATDEKHDAARWDQVAAERRREGRGSRSATSSTSAPNTPSAMGAAVAGPDGKPVHPEMGSYGIGVSRLVGAVIEASHDDAGIIWPDSIAPFKAADPEPEDRRRRPATRCASDSMPLRRQRAVRRPRRPGRGEVRRCRSDGPSLADRRRPARRRAGKVELKRRATGERVEARRPTTRWRGSADAGSAPMFGPFERMVAGRYLRARKGERFVSIIAIFSLVGIALGVATLIVVTSVMSGFQVELVSRILGVNGHITIEAYAGRRSTTMSRWPTQIRGMPGVASAPPVLDGQALLSTDSGGARGGLVRGISWTTCARCIRSATISSPATWPTLPAMMPSSSASAWPAPTGCGSAIR